MQAKANFIHLITIVTFSALSVTALAQEEQATTADEVARELANPNTVLGTLAFNLDYVCLIIDCQPLTSYACSV